MNFVVYLLLVFLYQPMSGLKSGEYFRFHHKEFFYIIEKDSIFSTQNGTEYKAWAHDIDWPHFNFNSLTLNNHVLLVSDGGGLVYQFKNNALQRLDNSFDHRNKYGSFDFVFNDILCSYGGYGLFTNSNKLTYFEKNANQWYEFLYNPKSEIPLARRAPIGQVSDSILYIGGGLTDYVNNDLKKESEILNDYWKLNLMTHQWTLLGLSDLGVSIDSEQLFSVEKKFIPYKDGVLSVHKTNAYWLDIKNNIIAHYPDAKTNLFDGIHQMDYNPNSDLFMISTKNHTTGLDQFSFIKSDELLGTTQNSDTLYSTRNYIIPLIVGFVVLIVVIFYRKRKPKTFKRVILDNMSAIENQLSEEEIKILKLILKEHPQAVSFPTILSFYELSLSYESRIKKLRLSLERINKVLNTYLNNDSLPLSFRKNRNDKRIKEVFLDTEE